MKTVTQFAEWLAPRAKAAAAGAAAFILGVQGAKDGGITVDEWLAIILATLAGAGLVYAVPNTSKRPQPPAK